MYAIRSYYVKRTEHFLPVFVSRSDVVKILLHLGGEVIVEDVGKMIHQKVVYHHADIRGDQLTCIFVNNGLLRKDEAEEVLQTFREGIGLHLEYVDAAERFLKALEGISDPEKKRMAIGETFIRA